MAPSSNTNGLKKSEMRTIHEHGHWQYREIAISFWRHLTERKIWLVSDWDSKGINWRWKTIEALIRHGKTATTLTKVSQGWFEKVTPQIRTNVYQERVKTHLHSQSRIVSVVFKISLMLNTTRLRHGPISTMYFCYLQVLIRVLIRVSWLHTHYTTRPMGFTVKNGTRLCTTLLTHVWWR